MNIFSVLDDSDDEQQQKPKVTEKKEAPKPAKAPIPGAPPAKAAPGAKPADAAKAAPKTDAKANAKPKSNEAANGKPKTDSKPAAAGDAENEQTKDDNRGGKPRGKDAPKRNENHKGKPEPEQARRPKHEFDRRSGTGRGKELSKGGRGAFGFGNVAQESLEAEKNPASAEIQIEATDAAVDGEAVAPSTPVPEAEPEPVTFTLDQYLAKRDEARAKAMQGVIGEVKPIRAVATSVFSGLQSKHKTASEESDYLPATKFASSKVAVIKDQRSLAKTTVSDVAFKFQAPVDRDRDVRVQTAGSERSDRPERRGRGEGRGEGRGRGGGRREGGDRNSGRGGGRGGNGGRDSNGGANRKSENSVFKTEDFPSL